MLTAAMLLIFILILIFIFIFILILIFIFIFIMHCQKCHCMQLHTNKWLNLTILGDALNGNSIICNDSTHV